MAGGCGGVLCRLVKRERVYKKAVLYGTVWLMAGLCDKYRIFDERKKNLKENLHEE